MHLSHHSTQNNKNISNEHVNTSKAFALYVSTMCTSGSANVQYGHVTDNKLSRQSLRKNRETIREFPCCNKHEIIIRFSRIVGKNAFFWDRVNASCLCFGTCMFCWPRCMKTYTVSSTTLDRCRPDVWKFLSRTNLLGVRTCIKQKQELNSSYTLFCVLSIHSWNFLVRMRRTLLFVNVLLCNAFKKSLSGIVCSGRHANMLRCKHWIQASRWCFSVYIKKSQITYNDTMWYSAVDLSYI